MLINPIVKFIKSYIIKFGFLDGKYGFIISWYSSYATFLKYYKLLKHQWKKQCSKKVALRERFLVLFDDFGGPPRAKNR